MSFYATRAGRRKFLSFAAGTAAAITSAATGLTLLAGCSKTAAPAGPQEPDADTVCALDGMTLNNYPGPKGQIRYAEGQPDFFCDLPDLFSVVRAPEQKRPVAAIYVQDMGVADWNKPRGHWIDARTATYVAGSRKMGSMGPTYGSFADPKAAAAFAAAEGGRVLDFAAIQAEPVAH